MIKALISQGSAFLVPSQASGAVKGAVPEDPNLSTGSYGSELEVKEGRGQRPMAMKSPLE